MAQRRNGGSIVMAYGEGIPPEELEYTEFLFRVEDLVGEWFGAFRASPQAPDKGDAVERLDVEGVEQRLEVRRLRREEGTEHLKGQEEGAA